jgi:uncharacterized protein (TIGR00730 family)
MNPLRSVCVYCGSSPGNDPAYAEAGHRLGEALSAAGLRLVYGGGTHGVMGAVARGVVQAGGKVAAIIPRFLIKHESTRAGLEQFDDVTITETMHERKHAMFERSDAFVALPGGLGTVEEIVEIMTWAQLGQHRKPTIFANLQGFWNPLLAMIDHMQDVGFLHSRHLVQPVVVDRVEEIVPALLSASRQPGTGVPAIIDKL